jgi:hypothetical protein
LAGVLVVTAGVVVAGVLVVAAGVFDVASGGFDIAAGGLELAAPGMFPAFADCWFWALTEFFAALTADWYRPSPPWPLGVPPLDDELGLSATIHSAKNTTVPTSSPTRGLETCVIRVIFGTGANSHKP